MVWHITIEVFGLKMVKNCFNKRELQEAINTFLENEVPFYVDWSKSVTA